MLWSFRVNQDQTATSAVRRTLWMAAAVAATAVMTAVVGPALVGLASAQAPAPGGPPTPPAALPVAPAPPPTVAAPVAQRIEPIVAPVVRKAPVVTARDRVKGASTITAAGPAATPEAATRPAAPQGVQAVGPAPAAPGPLRAAAKGRSPFPTNTRSALGAQPPACLAGQVFEKRSNQCVALAPARGARTGLLPKLKAATSRAVKLARPAPRRVR